MINQLLRIVKNNYEIIQVDCKEFSKIKASGMNFEIEAYNVPNLGRLSIMKAKGSKTV